MQQAAGLGYTELQTLFYFVKIVWAACNFECYYCDERFLTTPSVMNHTKNSHASKVKQCINFVKGACSYDNRCQFINEKTEGLYSNIYCNDCDESFKTKSHLLRHKKQYYTET